MKTKAMTMRQPVKRGSPGKSPEQSGPGTPRVFLLEDHPVMRMGLKMMLEQRGFSVCGEAERPEQALKDLATVEAEVAILDLSLGGEMALEAIGELRRRLPDLKIVIYSMHDTTLFVESAMRAGANGYVTKADPVETLIEAIFAVMAGKRHLGPALVKSLEPQAKAWMSTSALSELSPRETEVVTLLGKGFGLSEIADRLHVSSRTIETHLTRLREKLGAKNNRELTRAAIQFLHPI